MSCDWMSGSHSNSTCSACALRMVCVCARQSWYTSSMTWTIKQPINNRFTPSPVQTAAHGLLFCIQSSQEDCFLVQTLCSQTHPCHAKTHDDIPYRAGQLTMSTRVRTSSWYGCPSARSASTNRTYPTFSANFSWGKMISCSNIMLLCNWHFSEKKKRYRSLTHAIETFFLCCRKELIRAKSLVLPQRLTYHKHPDTKGLGSSKAAPMSACGCCFASSLTKFSTQSKRATVVASEFCTLATVDPAMMLFMTRITAIPALCASRPLFCNTTEQSRLLLQSK